jgi:hypothetical protein
MDLLLPNRDPLLCPDRNPSHPERHHVQRHDSQEADCHGQTDAGNACSQLN